MERLIYISKRILFCNNYKYYRTNLKGIFEADLQNIFGSSENPHKLQERHKPRWMKLHLKQKPS